MDRSTRGQVAHGKLVLQLERAEKRMRRAFRAFRAWDKALDAVRRSEKRLDKDFNTRSEIGGDYSPSDFKEANTAIHELAVEGARRLRASRRGGR